MNPIKAKTKDWLPPVLHNYLNRFVGRENNTSFEGSYNTWQEANVHCNCYDIGDFLEKVLLATLKVKTVNLFMNATLLFLINLNINGLY